MVRISLVFALLFSFSPISLADWKVELENDFLYGEKHHLVIDKTSNQSTGNFALTCDTAPSKDTSTFIAVFGIQISVPDSMKPRENERFELDIRVDDKRLRGLGGLFSSSQNGLFREDIFGIYQESSKRVIGSPGPIYRHDELRELLNEILDGNTLRYRLVYKSVDIRGLVDLVGLTKAVMPVLKTCSVESREQVALLKTYPEAKHDETMRRLKLQSQNDLK